MKKFPHWASRLASALVMVCVPLAALGAEPQGQQTSAVLALAFSPDGKWLASGDEGSNIKLWEVATGRLTSTVNAGSQVDSLAYSADGKRLITTLSASPNDDTMAIWDVETGKTLVTIANAGSKITVSADGKRIASWLRYERGATVWDADSGQALATLKEVNGTAAFSPDLSRLATVPDDPSEEIKLWEVAAGPPGTALKGHTSRVSVLAFSPDGKKLASGSRDNTVKLWDVGPGQVLSTLESHERQLKALAFSPDGKLLASGDQDGGLKLWDVATGKLLSSGFAFPGYTADINALAFSPDGKLLASGTGTVGVYDGRTLRLWDTASGRLVRSF